MHVKGVDDRVTRVLSLEGQIEVGAGENYRVGAHRDHACAGTEEELPLFRRTSPGHRDVLVGLAELFNLLIEGQRFSARELSIETGPHDNPGSKKADSSDAVSGKMGVEWSNP